MEMLKKLSVFVFALGLGVSLAQASPWVNCNNSCNAAYRNCIAWASTPGAAGLCDGKLEVCVERCNQGGH
jgi:hypothetical protein